MNSDDIRFLVPFLYDGENMVQRSPGSEASDLTKKVHHVFDIMREDPTLLRARDVAAVVYDTNSQIGKQDERMVHFQHVGAITHQLITALLEKNPDLPLPSPEVGRAMGLVHDLSNAFARYHGTFNQDERELALYHLAVDLNVPIVADAAQHSIYLEIANMIAKRKGFPDVERYSEWSNVYNSSDNRHNLGSMFAKYGNLHTAEGNDYVHGKDKLGLMALTVADYLDDRGDHSVDIKVDVTKIKEKFDLGLGEILVRHYHDPVKAGKSPTAAGVALVEEGGLQRMELYLKVVDNLLSERSHSWSKLSPEEKIFDEKRE